MATAVKRKLSGAPSGNLPIKVVQTATAGTTIHTSVAGTTAGTFDEVWLYAYNDHTSAVTLTLEIGGATVPDNTITMQIPNKNGLNLIMEGNVYQNGAVIRAFASVGNVVTISGWVNAITD